MGPLQSSAVEFHVAKEIGFDDCAPRQGAKVLLNMPLGVLCIRRGLEECFELRADLLSYEPILEAAAA
eukprot:2745212-Pyramimonas_sp.AAC.1